MFLAKQDFGLPPSLDTAMLNEWHVVATVAELAIDRVHTTRLFDVPLAILRSGNGDVGVWHNDGTWRRGQHADAARSDDRIKVTTRYGYVWASFGAPRHGVFDIPEMSEPDRLNLNTCTLGVHTSAPRAVENFFDMAHFPFVHTGYLGSESATEVKDYSVESSADGREIWARNCRFFQPRSSTTSSEGFEVEYVYRIPHPYCTILYKANATERQRMDVIGMFAQPLDEENINAILFCSILNEPNGAGFRSFQFLIMGQDKPILENHVFKRLPLDPRLEIPVRADALSSAYRRWLRALGVRYGTIPVVSQGHGKPS